MPDIVEQLNREGYKRARGERFTRTSIGALFLTLRRKGRIASSRKIQTHFWRATQLCKVLGIKRPTLTGWRHRDWVQARQVGSRWMYWADAEEIRRLKQLAEHPPSGSTPTPAALTTPVRSGATAS